VDGERLVHEETLAEKLDYEEDDEWEIVLAAAEALNVGDDVVGKRNTPEEMIALDLHAYVGAMCVGNCYTMAGVVALSGNPADCLENVRAY